MVQYEEMSLFYDQLTLDQPYDAWLDIVQTYAKDNASILDIGCGTGSFTSLLSTYNDVTGMDLSVDMLAMASQNQHM